MRTRAGRAGPTGSGRDVAGGGSKKARRFARELGLRSEAEWRQWCRGDLAGKPKRPPDIPAAPYVIYAEESWAGWPDWLGTARVRRPRLR